MGKEFLIRTFWYSGPLPLVLGMCLYYSTLKTHRFKVIGDPNERYEIAVSRNPADDWWTRPLWWADNEMVALKVKWWRPKKKD